MTSKPTDDLQKKVAVQMDDVDIRYRVYEEQFHSARNLVSGGFRSRQATEVHAVNQFTEEIFVGEAVGIVGANGSGKSTLLRAIAGLQSLHSGVIRVRGEAHLLGVGAALKPALSGYRNVILGGLAMGLSRTEISEKMDETVEFSGLGQAMGRPMNTYSSGMRARLSFSIATLRIPEILLIDEALAVGDKDFRERSLQRVNEIRDAAGTVIMVTHNLGEIRSTCTRAMWLDAGRLVASGDTKEVLRDYEQHSSLSRP
ncbi:ATP-binding cassette domain-containing protein [bacterium]|nr:ATP-binding cassette domain-containing protein [bacterium]